MTLKSKPEITPTAAADKLTAEAELRELLQRRILFLDGAMGTMVQSRELTEADFRGDRFQGHPSDLRGNNEILCLTRPGIIEEIHLAYYQAGADIVETNTFSANRFSQADYGLEDLCYELNVAAARLARRAADSARAAQPGRACFVAGALGPTNRTASLSPDVNNPGYRAVSFDQLVEVYLEQAKGLVDGGADVLLLETIFDTLNAKAALFALEELFERTGTRLPVMISVTVTDASGRTLSGQTIEAFWYSVAHAKPLSVGINCALGGREMRPYIEELAGIADCFISCYPNAGLPNAFGGYDETPEAMAEVMADFAAAGWLNIVGGCCGSTPEHIRAMVRAVSPHPPRPLPKLPAALRLSGLEPLVISN